ncbi:unnamed protein product, partial [Brassica oleracea]
KDGDYVHKGLKFGKVSRNAHKIVVDERVVLNFVQRKSGIATLTKILFHSFSSNWCGYIHLLQVKGGETNYLYKSNLKVETRTLEEVKKWIQDSVDGNNAGQYGCIPLENGDVDVTMLNDAVELINGRAETEASGNVTIETVGIHHGALTHSVNALDISLKIDTELALESRRRTKRA